MPSQLPNVGREGSLRFIAPKPKELAPEPTSTEFPRKRKSSTPSTAPRKKLATGKPATDKSAYCPVCYKRFTSVASRNSHIGRPICIDDAARRELSLPESFDAVKSANKNVHLKEASERFEEEDAKAKEILKHQLSIAAASKKVSTPVPRPTVGGIASSHSSSQVGGHQTSLRQSSYPLPSPRPQVPLPVQRSASNPLPHHQQQPYPPPDHPRRIAPRLSSATSLIQPLPVYPRQHNPPASTGHGAAYVSPRVPTPVPSMYPPYPRTQTLGGTASFGGNNQAFYAANAQPYPQAPFAFQGYGMSESSAASYHRAQVAQPQPAFPVPFPSGAHAMGNGSAYTPGGMPVPRQLVRSASAQAGYASTDAPAAVYASGGMPVPTQLIRSASAQAGYASTAAPAAAAYASGGMPVPTQVVRSASAQAGYASSSDAPAPVPAESQAQPAQPKLRWFQYVPAERTFPPMASPQPEPEPESGSESGSGSDSSSAVLLFTGDARDYRQVEAWADAQARHARAPSPFYPQRSTFGDWSGGDVNASTVSGGGFRAVDAEYATEVEQEDVGATAFDDRSSEEYAYKDAEDAADADAGGEAAVAPATRPQSSTRDITGDPMEMAARADDFLPFFGAASGSRTPSDWSSLSSHLTTPVIAGPSLACPSDSEIANCCAMLDEVQKNPVALAYFCAYFEPVAD
ncbi:hypothetical protein B0H15DRAFT_362404 [Mycena belliarum]|uniref:Uncharacterized protein n=1 Tax=Mycena belliarum TaxID=1033014 RepID=A0AAD6U242_9AGAR|nr:hypothetical protein B0H15DRAFT_362404 [Mycena belliae]